MSVAAEFASAAAAAVHDKFKTEPGVVEGGTSITIRPTHQIVKSEERHHISPDSSVSPEAPSRCPLCSAAFREESQLSRHLLDGHRVLSPPVRCPVCPPGEDGAGEVVQDLPRHIALRHPSKLGALAAGPLAAVAAAAAAAASSKGHLEITPVMVSSSSELAPPPLDLARNGATSHTSSSSTSGSSPTRSSPQLSSEDSLSLNQGEYGNRAEHNNNSGGTDLHVIPPSSNLLLRTTTEMLRAASGVPANNNNNNNNNNNSALPRARGRGVEASLPMNLCVKKQPVAVAHVNGGLHPHTHPVIPPHSSPLRVSSPPALHHFPTATPAAVTKAYNPGIAVAKLLKGSGSLPLHRKMSIVETSDDSALSSSDAAVSTRKRRKQTHVPEESKDERYWARRIKNNEAAKRSRDMRIKREKIVFDENMRLENTVAQVRAEMEKVATENKELHLKMDIIMEENNRLKSLLLSYQSREEVARRLSAEQDSSDKIDHPTAAAAAPPAPVPSSPPPYQRAYPLSAGPKKLLQLRAGQAAQEELKKMELRPFPFPDGAHN